MSQQTEWSNPFVRELLGEDLVVDWVLPGFLPRGSLIALAGMPGAGKSFLCYTLGIALATGTPVLGFSPGRPFKVAYFDDENSAADRIEYARWAWRGLGKPSPALLETNFLLASFELGHPRWLESASRLVKPFQPDIIFVDTTTPALHIQKEDDNAEAARAVRGLRSLQALSQPHATLVALKHAKLRTEGGYTLRGAKTWEGAVDGIVYHVRAKGRPGAHGMARTSLYPAKTRAFGLRDPVHIQPRATVEGSKIIALSLDRTFKPLPSDLDPE